MSEEVPPGVSIGGPEHEEFVRAVLEKYRPGGYLLGRSVSDMVRAYFKMDKADWLSLFMYDCTVAHLRRDNKALEELRAAYRQLAEILDWGVDEPWQILQRDPVKATEAAAEALFNFYHKRFRVEGWRAYDDEPLHAGLKRVLDFELSSIGDAFRTEFGRWLALSSMLSEMERDARGRDRVELLFDCQLEVMARAYLYGEAIRSCYIDHVLRGILSGGIVDACLEEALWLTFLAARDCEEARLVRSLGPLLCEDKLVWTMMWIDGINPEDIDEPRMEEKYLRRIESRFGRRDLVSLYREATAIEEGFFWSAFKDEWELSDKEREARRRQREASEKFFDAATEVINAMLEKKGLKTKVYAKLVCSARGFELRDLK